MNEGQLSKKELQEVFSKMGLDLLFVIQEAFLGYKYRKLRGKLYENDTLIPTSLIRMYYSLNPSDIEFDNMRKTFIRKYVMNESKLEGVHTQDEIAGFIDMYEYLHSEEFDHYFSIYSLKDLNQKLFSHATYPEYGGRYRNMDVYLPGSGVPLTEWCMIPQEMHQISPQVDYLHELAKLVKDSGDVDELLSFMDQCVELKCDLIRIHPFIDGNGRTVRAFINKLFEDAGLPAIYVKSGERAEYQKAMNQALGDGDTTAIKLFYRYKVCDSIIELDINERMRRQLKEVKEKGYQKRKKGEK